MIAKFKFLFELNIKDSTLFNIMSNQANNSPANVLSSMLTVDLTRELALEAELLSPDGYVSDEVKEHIITITNTHLLTSGEPRNLWVLATSALFLTDSLPDVEFMSDEDIARTIYEGRTVARGQLYGVEHIATSAFSGFGLRFFGVDLEEPNRAHRESLFVPVDSVALTLPAK